MNDVALPAEERRRVVIENVTPGVDAGRFPIKRCRGDRVAVTADCFCDGHDAVFAMLRYRRESATSWHETPMQHSGQDRFAGQFEVDSLRTWRYGIVAWVDRFRSWRHEFERWEQPGDVRLAAIAGAALIDELATRTADDDRTRLLEWAGPIGNATPCIACSRPIRSITFQMQASAPTPCISCAIMLICISQGAESARAMIALFTLERTLYELRYELDNRPDALGVPLRGLLDMVRP